MELYDVLNEAHRWQKDTFDVANPESMIAHLSEEVEELINGLKEFREVSKNPSIAVGEYYRKLENVKNEFADCFLLLFGSAMTLGYDLEGIAELISDKMEVNKKRKWGQPDKNGVIHHITVS